MTRKRKAKTIGRDKKRAFEIARTINAQLSLGDLGIIDKKQEVTFGEYAKSYIKVQYIDDFKGFKYLYSLLYHE